MKLTIVGGIVIVAAIVAAILLIRFLSQSGVPGSKPEQLKPEQPKPEGVEV